MVDDVRQPSGDSDQVRRAYGEHPPVDLRPDQAGREGAAESARSEGSTRLSPSEHDPAKQPQAVDTELHTLVRNHLKKLNRYILVLLVILFIGAAYFIISPALRKPAAEPAAQPTGAPESTQDRAGGTNFVSCLSQTGPDATTTSSSFVDIDGTQCTYHSGPTAETLILNGKLTGRNTEGTGMSVNIAVNGKECNGGETLNYARTYTPMFSNCVFVVPANSAVQIKWRFLSPFGGTAAVLRSNKNIAPSITGVAIPKTDSSPASPSPPPSG